MTAPRPAFLDHPVARRDETRILTFVVACALIAQGLRRLARRLDPRSPK